MSGDPDNTSVWGDCNAYISFDPEATLPATIDDEWGPEWELVGILDGSAGMNEQRTRSETDHSGWGVGIIKTSYKDAKLTRTFTALEWNETTRRLAYPGSVPGKLKFGKPEDVRFAYETTEADKKRRRCTAGHANLTVSGNIEEAEDKLENFPFTATIYPDDDGFHYLEQSTEELGS